MNRGSRASSRIAELLLASLLACASATPQLDAAALLHLFEGRLQEEPEGEDMARVRADLEGLRVAGLPDVRLRQSMTWSHSLAPDLSLGLSLAAPLLDPERLAREAQVEQRLNLTRFNDQSGRRQRSYDFRSRLRLLAHVEEVVEVLAGYRQSLLERRPGLLDLERAGPPAAVDAAIDPEGIAYLEVVHALASTLGERQILLESVARPVGLTVEELSTGHIGRPPPGEAYEEGDVQACLRHNDEARRAELVHQETILAAQADAAASDTQLTLDLSADLRYRAAPASLPPGSAWNADIRLSLHFRLPPVAGIAPRLSLHASPADVRQELTLQWPPSGVVRPHLHSAAERAYRQAQDEVSLQLRKLLGSWRDAVSRAELRRLSLTQAEEALVTAGAAAGPTGGATAGPALEQAVAQAKLGLLNAELERDLAALELESSCPSSAQARTSATSRFKLSIRSTRSASSA